MTLRAEILSCRRCAAMAGARRVPGEGPQGVRLFFLAEAPGRWGAGRTGHPLLGDRSGDLFAAMLAAVGLRREEVFVSNVVKCNPLDAAGRNRRPTAREIASCRPFWLREVAWARPTLLVPLGDVACREVVGLPLHRARGRLWTTPRGPAYPMVHPAYVTRHRYGVERYRTDWLAMLEVLAGVQAVADPSGPVVRDRRNTASPATAS
jgi:uracil-DNA glycosylase family 4